MSIQLQLGLEVIQSYKRLSYTPWHAIAELVDNSTQSYFNNRDALDKSFETNGDSLTIGIVYDKDNGGLLRVSDNAMGMSFPELENALKVGFPPAITSGRSQYGMGMKTSACWIGNLWTIRTTKLNESIEHIVTVDVDTVARGDANLQYKNEIADPASHYTVIEISNHNRVFQGRTLWKIREFLRSMYRQDLRRQAVEIEWGGNKLKWDDSQFEFLTASDGSAYRKEFHFTVCDKNVRGWVGILSHGSRANAGFSILRADRVIRGWPDSWRPSSLYGQLQGSNNLVNQRLIGEVHLDEFVVSHTKDDILWMGEEEEEIERLLKDTCAHYVEIAQSHRIRKEGEGGPSEAEQQAAIDQFKNELASAELADAVALQTILPPTEAITSTLTALKRAIGNRNPTLNAMVNDLEVVGFLMADGSPNDPYVVVESTDDHRVLIIINSQHPHFSQLVGSEGLLNYLRHCVYDAIAEWQAHHRVGNINPDTIKILKDRLLRVPFEIEMRSESRGLTPP